MCQILAHRGYAARFPENTRESISAAVEAGVRLVEFDVQLSRDRVPYLLHDEDFLRTGEDPARIFDLDAADIANLSVGEPARFGQNFSGVRAPSLSNVVADLAAWPNVTAFVELKRQSIAEFGAERVLDAVLPVLEPVFAQTVVISFDAQIVELARERAAVPIGWVVREWAEPARQKAEAMQPDYLFCNINRLPPEPEELWAGGWLWVAYEVTDAATARQLAARGVAIVESMACGDLRAELGGDA